MLFDFETLAPRDIYKLLVSTVVPRPIAWVVTQSRAGVVNAAPFSFFNAMSSDPPIVAIGIGARPSGDPKDTARNIAETGQFVVNLVSEEVAEQMNVTAVDYDYGVDELAEAGLSAVASAKVTPPRIGESAVAIECLTHEIVRVGTANSIVLGRGVAMHVRDDAVLNVEKLYINTPVLKLIGRMHGSGMYVRTRDAFEMPRLPPVPR